MLDYHIHSTHSLDATASVAGMCARAIELGLAEIAFAEHVDNNPLDDCFGRFDPRAFSGEIEQAGRRFGDRLRILKGVELGEPHLYPREIGELLSRSAFEVVIGAVHWIGDTIISIDAFSHLDVEALYHRYFDEVLKTAEQSDIDVLAHIDLVKRFGVKYLGPFHVEPFRGQIEAVLRTIIRRGIALEVNTSGLRQPCREPFPGPEILALYRELGGHLVTMGSDAHTPEHLGSGLAEALEMIRAAGFESVTSYRARVASSEKTTGVQDLGSR